MLHSPTLERPEFLNFNHSALATPSERHASSDLSERAPSVPPRTPSPAPAALLLRPPVNTLLQSCGTLKRWLASAGVTPTEGALASTAVTLGAAATGLMLAHALPLWGPALLVGGTLAVAMILVATAWGQRARQRTTVQTYAAQLTEVRRALRQSQRDTRKMAREADAVRESCDEALQAAQAREDELRTISERLAAFLATPIENTLPMHCEPNNLGLQERTRALELAEADLARREDVVDQKMRVTERLLSQARKKREEAAARVQETQAEQRDTLTKTSADAKELLNRARAELTAARQEARHIIAEANAQAEDIVENGRRLAAAATQT